MIRHKDLAGTLIWMGQSMRDSGKKINNMVKVESNGLMGLFMKVIMSWVRNMEKASSFGLMVQFMKDNSTITT